MAAAGKGRRYINPGEMRSAGRADPSGAGAQPRRKDAEKRAASGADKRSAGRADKQSVGRAPKNGLV